jgi:phosphatidylglycerophosphate synthase
LPLYRRLLVTPLLPFIPTRVHPNSITHAGHLLCLLGAATVVCMGASSGWSFVVAALGVQLYNWCDNADGAHARRTGQCSAMGELLDHGLDVLNVTYISFMSSIALGAPPMMWLVMAMVITSASSATYWEQAETGVFRLGRLNQIESLTLLSAVLTASAIFGTELWTRIALGPVNARLAIVAFTVTMTLTGIVHGMWRVFRARGATRVLPIMPLVAFLVAVCIAAATGAMSLLAAIIVGSVGNAFFALRMLSMRLAGERPRFEAALAFGAVLLGALIVWRLVGRPVGLLSDASYATLAAVVFGGAGLINARAGVKRVVRLDAAAAQRS